MKKKRLIILIIVLTSFFGIRYLILKPAFSYLSGYLSKSEQVKADVLVVEGWIPYDALELAYDEYRKGGYKYVVTTGIRYTPSYYKISDNGYLIFYTGDLLSGLTESGSHSIGIKAFSDMGGDDRAHFNFFINDSLAGSFNAEKRKKLYTVTWHGSLKDIDSVMVQYDNDIYEPPLDRNLSVKEISFDNKITIPYLFHSEYDMLKLDGKLRFRNNLITTAQFARSKLISFGIDSTMIIAVSAKKAGINRTLTSALAFRDWLAANSGGKEIRGINIVTLGPHARRTWMTYNKILKEKYRIGIISLPDSGKQISGQRKAFKTLRETLGIIYYWFILIPY
jgi:Ca-dependent carbohydrate-binding module xylan-binding